MTFWWNEEVKRVVKENETHTLTQIHQMTRWVQRTENSSEEDR